MASQPVGECAADGLCSKGIGEVERCPEFCGVTGLGQGALDSHRLTSDGILDR